MTDRYFIDYDNDWMEMTILDTKAWLSTGHGEQHSITPETAGMILAQMVKLHSWLRVESTAVSLDSHPGAYYHVEMRTPPVLWSTLVDGTSVVVELYKWWDGYHYQVWESSQPGGRSHTYLGGDGPFSYRYEAIKRAQLEAIDHHILSSHPYHIPEPEEPLWDVYEGDDVLHHSQPRELACQLVTGTWPLGARRGMRISPGHPGWAQESW